MFVFLFVTKLFSPVGKKGLMGTVQTLLITIDSSYIFSMSVGAIPQWFRSSRPIIKFWLGQNKMAANKLKCHTVKYPTVKCPTVKYPAVKCPTVKCPTVKCPTVKCPTVKCPRVKCRRVKCPRLKCPRVKCPTVKFLWLNSYG